MRKTSIMFLLLTFAVWLGCLAAGHQLSQRRPLWNDELYSHTNSIAPVSYSEMIRGRIPEGNNCPLFYLLQKSLCEYFGYQFPGEWRGEWFVREEKSQVVLRILSNIFMSTAIALIFYYFGRFYSIGAGIAALAVTASMPMVWMYWTEARPYSLWFLLTAVQALLFLSLTAKQQGSSRLWWWLALTNILLSITVSVAIAQVFVVSFLLWLFQEKRLLRYGLLLALPLLLSVYYYGTALKFKFWFREGPLQLILNNVPVELWVIFIFFAAMVFIKKFINRSVDSSAGLESVRSFLFFVGMFTIVIALLIYLKSTALLTQNVGFAISNRYFIFLVPLAIMASVLGVVQLWRGFKDDPWIRVNIFLVILGLLALRIFKTYIFVLASGTFTHFIR